MIIDGYIKKTGSRSAPPTNTAPPKKTGRETKDKISADTDNPNIRNQYYTSITQSDMEVWVPNDNLKKLCQTGGCDINTIVAKYQPSQESKFQIFNVSEHGGLFTGEAGTSGNQYITNSSQSQGEVQGVSGFYVAPNGRWYPISVPPPPRNPNEPYSQEVNPITPTEKIVVIMTLTPTPTPYLGPWPRPDDEPSGYRYKGG